MGYKCKHDMQQTLFGLGLLRQHHLVQGPSIRPYSGVRACHYPIARRDRTRQARKTPACSNSYKNEHHCDSLYVPWAEGRIYVA